MTEKIETDEEFERRVANMHSERYKDEVLPSVEDASRTFRQFLEARGAHKLDPMSPEALQLQMEYLQDLESNKHPLDVLRTIALNPFATPRDRISAAKTIMEYTMIKTPSKVEVAGLAGGPVRLDVSQLAKLSDSELNSLMQLLEKTGS